MRLSESKVIIEALSEACGNAEGTGRIDVDALLSKPEFVRSLRELWAHIPEKTRRSIYRQPRKTRVGGYQVKPQQLDKPKITPSQDLLADIPCWAETPSSFFQERGNLLDLENSPITHIYEYLEQLDLRQNIDTIRARFVKIAFHRLKERLGVRYMRTDSVDDIVTIVSKSGLTSNVRGDIKTKINRWTDIGRRIDSLCRSIGGSSAHENSHLGNLFCLPEGCHDEFIRVLHLAGPDRDQQIQQIKDRGILEVQDRSILDTVAAKVFGVVWDKVAASIDDIITQSPESALARDLQYTPCFLLEEQPPKQVRQPNTSIPIDKPSASSDAVENIRSDPQSHVSTAHASATAIRAPEIASAESRESSGHSYDNVTNQPLNGFDLRNGQTSVNIANIVNVDDMMQPILPAQGFTPFNEQIQENAGNMVVDDMLQPVLSAQDCGFTHQQTSNNVNMGNVGMIQQILPTQDFTPFSEQIQENAGNMVVDDMLQPILPAHVYEPPEGQPHTNMANMVGIRDISRPISPQVFTLPNSRSNAMETTEPHMFQSTIPVPEPGPVGKQTPLTHGGLWPRTTASQNTHNQNPFYSCQPVPAA